MLRSLSTIVLFLGLTASSMSFATCPIEIESSGTEIDAPRWLYAYGPLWWKHETLMALYKHLNWFSDKRHLNVNHYVAIERGYSSFLAIRYSKSACGGEIGIDHTKETFLLKIGTTVTDDGRDLKIWAVQDESRAWGNPKRHAGVLFYRYR